MHATQQTIFFSPVLSATISESDLAIGAGLIGVGDSCIAAVEPGHVSTLIDRSIIICTPENLEILTEIIVQMR